MNTETLASTFSGRLITAAADMAPYLTDWRKRWTGRAIAVAQPDTAHDVAAVVRWCAAHRVPVVAQGGNTGMSGAATPDTTGNALVLSLARMNRVRGIDALNNTMTVEAGCILQTVQDAAREAGRLFPLSLAAEGSCTIGGNLSTNAGGVAVLRFGNARELCLGLEVVTAQGEIWNGLRGLRKDNTGYDLRDLFIGAEGTLGVITAATMKLFPLPAAKVTAWAAVNTLPDAMRLLQTAQNTLGARLTAFELLTQPCIEILTEQLPQLRWPLAARQTNAVLIEVSDPQSETIGRAALETLLEGAFESGKNIKHDISIPISGIAEFVASTNAALAKAYPGVRMIVFGHLGDGNLHYNVSPVKGSVGDNFAAIEGDINRITHDAVHAFNGSVSAEHGLGVLRRGEAARYKSAVELNLMGAIKQALDPQGIMNPGKGLPL
jgi:FAD/FMN-containing dehydrogenase